MVCTHQYSSNPKNKGLLCVWLLYFVKATGRSGASYLSYSVILIPEEKQKRKKMK